MNTKNVQKLHNLARRQQRAKRELVSYFLPFSKAQICSDMHKLACAIHDKEQLPDSEILATFFTFEAVKFLLTMPNRYWFWRTVEWACVFSSEPSDSLISLEAAQRAVRKLRLDFNVSKYDLTVSPKQLSIANLADRVAQGIILVDHNDRGRIRFNPLFAPQTKEA
jgi:hypothetical protein